MNHTPIAVDHVKIRSARRRYCQEINQSVLYPVDFLKFVKWAEANEPETLIELEKYAANIFNAEI